MPKPTICVVGSANVDLTFRAARLPLPGETVFGDGFLQGFGGKGANQAVAAARMGERVHFIGRVGNDSFGTTMRQQLQAEGIDITHLTVDDQQPSGTAAILVGSNGENSIVVVPGANATLTPHHIRTAEAVIRESTIILAQCETPLTATLEAFRIAHSAKRLCVLNPAPACPLPSELLQLTNILIPNESELQQLTGGICNTWKRKIVAAWHFLTRGTQNVVVTLGERGALLATETKSVPIATTKVQAVDTSGAGDAFCGALVTALADGSAIEDAIRFANRCASISVTRMGTQTSFPKRTEVEG